MQALRGHHPHRPPPGGAADPVARRPATGAAPWPTCTTDDPTTTSPAAGVALQVVAAASATAARIAADTGPRVTIRPLRRGKSGKWVKTGASWHDVESPYAATWGRRRPPPARRAARPDGQRADRVLLGRARPYRSTSSAPTSGTSSSGRSTSASSWSASTRARGRAVRGTARGQRRPHRGRHRRGAPHHRVRARRPAAGPSTDDSGLVGAPPHGLWIAARVIACSSCRSTRRCTRPSPGSRRTARSPCPADDVDELLDVYQPALARHATVGSSDGSVTITTNAFDGLVLVVERTALDAAALRWYARYRRGERTRAPAPSLRVRRHAAATASPRPPRSPRSKLPTPPAPRASPTRRARRATSRLAGRTRSRCSPTSCRGWRRTDGVDVEVVGDQPTLRGHRRTRSSRSPSPTVRQRGARDGNDWFDLDVEVSVDGESDRLRLAVRRARPRRRAC